MQNVLNPLGGKKSLAKGRLASEVTQWREVSRAIRSKNDIIALIFSIFGGDLFHSFVLLSSSSPSPKPSSCSIRTWQGKSRISDDVPGRARGEGKNNWALHRKNNNNRLFFDSQGGILRTAQLSIRDRSWRSEHCLFTWAPLGSKPFCWESRLFCQLRLREGRRACISVMRIISVFTNFL